MESVLAYLATRALQNRGQFVNAPDMMSRVADLVGLISAGKGAFGNGGKNGIS